jgi:hypothetical protein
MYEKTLRRDAPIAAGDTSRRPLLELRQERSNKRPWSAVRQRFLPIAHEGTWGFSTSRYASCCHGGMEGALTEEWTQWWRATLSTGPYCSGARQLRESAWRAEKSIWEKEMSTEGLVFDWSRAILRPKVMNRKHARTSRLGTATESSLITHLSISALFPFTRLITTGIWSIHIPTIQIPLLLPSIIRVLVLVMISLP